ncbi:hypothetical protein [Streptomyces sp. NPDC056660]|uniref:AMP-binding enzyme n=1 Tax=Streptomyces sp. NPDC056660 TaxID=3345897 RepID=UPI00368A26EA
MVAVVPRPGHLLNAPDLVRHCAGELPAFAVPRYVDTVPELPLTETGNVRKRSCGSAGSPPPPGTARAAKRRFYDISRHLLSEVMVNLRVVVDQGTAGVSVVDADGEPVVVRAGF